MSDHEMLEATQSIVRPQRRRRRRSRRLKTVRRLFRNVQIRLVMVIVLVVVIVAAVGSGVLITDALNQLEGSEESLSRILTTLSNKPADTWTYSDFERLQTAVNDLHEDLNRAEQRTFFLKPIRGINNNLAITLDALEAAQSLTQATDRMLTGLRPALFFLTEGQAESAVTVSSGERTVELLSLGRGQFVEANNFLQTAAGQIAAFDKGSVSEELLLVVEDLEHYYNQVRDINTILLQAPELLSTMLGLDGEKHYLILAQNNDELRPSGGYISTYGWMTVENSRITDFDYFPSTQNTPNPPPLEMGTEVALPQWWIPYGQPIFAAWDGSWYADFSQTAALAVWYYENGHNPPGQIDGVIAVDIVGLEYLLGAFGAVTVPRYDEVVTTENFREVVYDIRASGQGDLPHKQFLAALYNQLLEAWQSVPPEKKSAVLGAQLRALREKHVLLYFSEPNLNDALVTLGWGGVQTAATEHDYLMVADANVSANKANRSIRREVTLDVQIERDGSLNNRATVAYDYSATVARNDPAIRPEHYTNINYFNRLQVFTPSGSRLTNSDNTLGEVYEEQTGSHAIFATFVGVYYDTAERFQFSYTTPILVESFGDYHHYRLLLQKQAGTLSDRVTVIVQLPPGAATVYISPDPAERFTLERPLLQFAIELERDKWIEIIYK